jgi:hypothetical protein
MQNEATSEAEAERQLQVVFAFGESILRHQAPAVRRLALRAKLGA